MKVRSLVTAAKQTSWPCILQASKSCRSHSHLKAFRSAIASLKLKRKANCIRAGSFSPLPLLPSSRNGLTASLLLIPLTPYKEALFGPNAKKLIHQEELEKILPNRPSVEENLENIVFQSDYRYEFYYGYVFYKGKFVDDNIDRINYPRVK